MIGQLKVTPASFEDANGLRKALLRAAKGINFGSGAFDTDLDKGAAGILANPAAASAALDRLLAVASSDEVEEAIFKCAGRAVYEGLRVSKELFDDPKLGEQAREDYHEIMMQVAKANVGPFFKQTFSGLKDLLAKPESGPK